MKTFLEVNPYPRFAGILQFPKDLNDFCSWFLLKLKIMLAEVPSNSKIVFSNEHTLQNPINPIDYDVNRQMIRSFKGGDENKGILNPRDGHRGLR